MAGRDPLSREAWRRGAMLVVVLATGPVVGLAARLVAGPATVRGGAMSFQGTLQFRREAIQTGKCWLAV